MTGPLTVSRRAVLQVWILRVAFALLMAVSGVAKLLDMTGFYAVVESYRSLPGPLIVPAAWSLAISGSGLAIWLLTGRWPRSAAAVLVLLHGGYLAWISLALARGLELSNCGCFGVYFAQPLTVWTLLEDVLLLGLALVFRHLIASRYPH